VPPSPEGGTVFCGGVLPASQRWFSVFIPPRFSLLRIIDQSSPGLRLVSAELVRLVTPQDLTVAIAPGNRKLVAVGTAELERCACADQMLYTFTGLG